MGDPDKQACPEGQIGAEWVPANDPLSESGCGTWDTKTCHVPEAPKCSVQCQNRHQEPCPAGQTGALWIPASASDPNCSAECGTWDKKTCRVKEKPYEPPSRPEKGGYCQPIIVDGVATDCDWDAGDFSWSGGWTG